MTSARDDKPRRDIRQSDKQRIALRLAHNTGRGLGHSEAVALAEAFCELWDELDAMLAERTVVPSAVAPMLLRLADRAARGSLNADEHVDAAARLGSALLKATSTQSAKGALLPEKIIDALREVCYVPGHFEAIAHLKYCRWCHYVETQPHGHDCPMLLLESAATDRTTTPE